MNKRNFLSNMKKGIEATAIVLGAYAIDEFVKKIPPVYAVPNISYMWPALSSTPEIELRFSEKDWISKKANLDLIKIDDHKFRLYSGYMLSSDGSSLKRYSQVVWLTRKIPLCGDQYNVIVRPRDSDKDFPLPQDYAMNLFWDGSRKCEPADTPKVCIYEGNGASGFAKICEDSSLVNAKMFVDAPIRLTNLLTPRGEDFNTPYEKCAGFILEWDLLNPPNKRPESKIDTPAQFDSLSRRLYYKERHEIGNIYSTQNYCLPGDTIVPQSDDWWQEFTRPSEWAYVGLDNFPVTQALLEPNPTVIIAAALLATIGGITYRKEKIKNQGERKSRK